MLVTREPPQAAKSSELKSEVKSDLAQKVVELCVRASHGTSTQAIRARVI